ncbi:MAG: ISAs1 family transposase [Treponema sp.]|nr:ISAs1 family transposase [Treponema sp.]
MVEGFFDEIPDSRQDWKVLHSIDEILTVVMCGVSAGENTIHGIYAFSEIKERWLREKVGLKLPNGLPSYDTIRRTMGMIDTKVFQRLFIKWIEEKLNLKEGSYISIDGKTVKGSGNDEKSKGKETVESRYFICSIDDMIDFAEAVRSHWAVVNNLHWCLDVIFNEDACPILDKNTAENIAIIRRIIYNRIKMQLKPKEQLCFGKRSCMYDDGYRLKIMFSHI